MALTNTQREELVAKISQIDGLNCEERSAMIDALRQRDSYGLHWEDKPEEAEERLRVSLPVLTEVTSKSIINGGDDSPNHILIEGDNLEALTALTYTHTGKIDVIYIDPPYNTGNKDFCYNDKYVDSEDSYRHSKWLSFMSKRLRIAKQLLSDRGVIFISIDDNEQAQLKILCDEIFGADNFSGNVIWEKTDSPRMDVKGFTVRHDYILVYQKAAFVLKRLHPDEIPDHYNKVDNNGRRYYLKPLRLMGGHKSESLYYGIEAPDGSVIYPLEKNGDKGCWRWSRDKYEAEIERIEWIKGKSGWSANFRIYADNLKATPVNTVWQFEKVGSTRTAKTELSNIIQQSIFSYPKPSSLIAFILKISSEKDSTILDFFAGSGTTMHAVMQLNKEDGGHRQCILVTNNENGICENVTYERNKRVINGYTKPNGESVEGLHANNLRYYRTMLLPRDTSHHYKEQLMWQLTDQLCIKEDLYAETDIVVGGRKVKKQYAQCFASARRTMIIIYRPEVIKHVAEFIKGVPAAKKVKVYVFSDGQYAFDDDFGEALGRITLCALPDALYQAYRTALPDRPRATAWTVDSDSPEAIEALNATQNQTYVTEAEEQS